MSKYLNTYKIESARLSTHDYSANAIYFITINTYRNKKYFGDFVQTRQGASPKLYEQINLETHHSASLRLTEIGKVAQTNWNAIPKHFPFIRLDEFIIMPNHMHGILHFEGIKKHEYESNKFEAKKGSLGTVINLFKGGITHYANLNNIEFKWQSRYHDRIIQDYDELNNVRNYINRNPLNWK